MADFDSKLPVRALAVDFTTEIADSAGTTINPAKEDGHLANIDTATASIDSDFDVALSTRASEATLSSIDTSLNNVESSLNIIDDWDDGSDRAKINTIALNGNTISTNTGNSDAGTQRVVIATDQPTLPVTFTPSTRANRISYNTSAALAAGASSTHTFTPGVAFRLQEIYASASGQLKVEIQTGTTGAETTKAVLFTSKGHLIAEWRLTDELAVPTTDSVKVIRTNFDNQAMDVYSSIQGVDA